MAVDSAVMAAAAGTARRIVMRWGQNVSRDLRLFGPSSHVNTPHGQSVRSDFADGLPRGDVLVAEVLRRCCFSQH